MNYINELRRIEYKKKGKKKMLNISSVSEQTDTNHVS